MLGISFFEFLPFSFLSPSPLLAYLVCLFVYIVVVVVVFFNIEQYVEPRLMCLPNQMRLAEGGYLWKRGVRGPMGGKWRYRWFKAKKNGEIRYYKRDGKTKTFIGLVSE